jgi:hypothetical protein
MMLVPQLRLPYAAFILALAARVPALAAPAHADGLPPVFATAWGDTGMADGAFHRIAGIAVSPTGDVYVVDSELARIQRFSPQGVFQFKWGFGEMVHPVGLATDTHGHVFVADYYAQQILRYDTQGNLETAWGNFGTAPSQFEYPVDVEVEPDGNVIVVDQFNDRLQRFTPDGVFVKQIGDSGSGDGGLSRPVSVAVDPDGNLYVTDQGHHRVQKFDHDGHFVTKWGTEGSGPGQFPGPQGPAGIVIDADHTVYVVDTHSSRVEMFTDAGTYLGEFGSRGTAPGMFKFPAFMAVSPTFEIYVGDVDNNRVQKFSAAILTSVSVNITPGHVAVTWVASEAASLPATVYRRTGTTEWTIVGTTMFDGSGRAVYDDHDVVAGEVYTYRVGISSSGHQYLRGEIAAVAPIPADLLALETAGGNPVRGSIALVVTLGSGTPAKLDLFDVRGRRLESHVLTSGPKRYVIQAADDRALPAGMYFARLVQGAQQRSVRIALIR